MCIRNFGQRVVANIDLNIDQARMIRHVHTPYIPHPFITRTWPDSVTGRSQTSVPQCRPWSHGWLLVCQDSPASQPLSHAQMLHTPSLFHSRLFQAINNTAIVCCHCTHTVHWCLLHCRELCTREWQRYNHEEVRWKRVERLEGSHGWCAATICARV